MYKRQVFLVIFTILTFTVPGFSSTGKLVYAYITYLSLIHICCCRRFGWVKKIPIYIWAVACGVTVLAVSGAVSSVVCHALPQNGGGTVYQGTPVSTDTCDCAHRVCGGSGLAAWCSNGSCASFGSLLPGGTLHKKAPDAGGKTAAARCGRDKGAFKDPGKMCIRDRHSIVTCVNLTV